jgi:hypothetical protein
MTSPTANKPAICGVSRGGSWCSIQIRSPAQSSSSCGDDHLIYARVEGHRHPPFRGRPALAVLASWRALDLEAAEDLVDGRGGTVKKSG